MLVRRPLTKSVELVLSLFQSEINNPQSTLISLFVGAINDSLELFGLIDTI
jgi:hypothetical protein